MSKTKAQLEEEVEALRAVLAAIGEGMPPLPEDPEKMRLYTLECASRLSMATAVAEGIADCREDFLVPYAQETVKDLRTRWGRPLHYEPEANAMPATPDPEPGACTCGHVLSDHIYAAPGPCTQCGCKEFSAAVTDEDAATAIAADAVAIIAESIRTGQPVITEYDTFSPGEFKAHKTDCICWDCEDARAEHIGGSVVPEILAARDAAAQQTLEHLHERLARTEETAAPVVGEGITGLHWDNLSSSGGPA